jgi:bis(5'-nucleosyl)-tetraphosphatase (symmetrical)
MSTYVIGDIHGCYNELILLIKKINFNPNKDKIICAGDIVNKGYNNLDCILYLMDIDAKVTLGNHDLLLLQLLNSPNKSTLKHNLHDILNHEKAEKINQWLINQELVIYLDEFDTTIVHAGIHPSWTKRDYLEYAALVKQNISTIKFNKNAISKKTSNKIDFYTNCFTRMRLLEDNLDLDLENIKLDTKLTPWFELYKQKETIVFGHWSFLRGKTTNKKTINIDTGCVYNDKLTCIRLEDLKKFYVESHSS